MSRSTPRKSRNAQQPQQSPAVAHPHSYTQTQTHTRTRSQHLQQQHQQQFLTASDYESDTAYYMASHPGPSPASLANRTNTDLNLSVLKRYLPSISTILSVATNAVVYTFSTTIGNWEKANIEGTFFVCSSGHDGPGDNAYIIVLNRKGLENLILDLRTVSTYELQSELLIFKLDDHADEAATVKALGIWIHSEKENTREENAALIHHLWTRTREARPLDDLGNSAHVESAQVGPAMQAMGRRVSLSALFGAQNGASGGA